MPTFLSGSYTDYDVCCRLCNRNNKGSLALQVWEAYTTNAIQGASKSLVKAELSKGKLRS